MIVALDQGTTSCRVILFDEKLQAVHWEQQEFTQHFPENGWVEHDLNDIWQITLALLKKVLDKASEPVKAIGITNQRETIALWDKATGVPVARAIVWQDRRTESFLSSIQGESSWVRAKTGLPLDPYFSASKLKWLLDQDDLRARAMRGELLAGTIDTFLLWNLTEGKSHFTDATNASRTLLYDIHDGSWSEELLELFEVPRVILPEVLNSADDFGKTSKEVVGQVLPVGAMIGDQQSALVGQGCLSRGSAKVTYGTGAFALLNTGDKAPLSQNGLLTTVAYQLQGKRTYALEGSVFIAGAGVSWLKNSLGLISSIQDLELLLSSDEPEISSVYMVPAFTGLGTPYWDPKARGAIFGLTRDSGKSEIVRAVLNSVAYQSYDLFKAMEQDLQSEDLKSAVCELRIDGGMSSNSWFTQRLADILHIDLQVSKFTESTALGAAVLAAHQMGLLVLSDFKTGEVEVIKAKMSKEMKKQHLQGWQNAVQAVLSYTHS